MTSSRITANACSAIIAWCLALTLAPAASAQTAIMHVDINNGSLNPPNFGRDGWGSDAYRFLQDALAGAEQLLNAPVDPPENVQIWVAQGTYRPDQRAANGASAPCPDYGDCDPDATFRLIRDVEIYGGFFGDETDIAQRDPATNITILSGDLEEDDDFDATMVNGVLQLTFDNYGDNSYHVVTAIDADATCVINGVMIHGPVMIRSGSPRLLDCTFRADRGHGWNRGVDAASAMVHCGDDAAPALVRPRYVEPGARSALTR